jgi:hypothetical protein
MWQQFVQALHQLGWTEGQNLRIDMPPNSRAATSPI